MAETPTGKPGPALDRLFWVRGTLATVMCGPLLLGAFLIPKWLHLWQELGVEDLPFPLLLLGHIHLLLAASPVLVALWVLVLMTGAAVSWLRARSRAQAIAEWAIAAVVILVGLLYVAGFAANWLAIMGIVSDLSATP